MEDVQIWILLVGFLVTLIAAIIGSAGFWTWLSKRDTLKGATTQLLLGLAHDRIIFLGMKYIDRGFITSDEYEDFIKYLWGPYSKFGGNGLAEKVVDEVKRLRIQGTSNPIYQHIEEKHVEQHHAGVRHTGGRSQGSSAE